MFNTPLMIASFKTGSALNAKSNHRFPNPIKIPTHNPYCAP